MQYTSLLMSTIYLHIVFHVYISDDSMDCITICVFFYKFEAIKKCLNSKTKIITVDIGYSFIFNFIYITSSNRIKICAMIVEINLLLFIIIVYYYYNLERNVATHY